MTTTEGAATATVRVMSPEEIAARGGGTPVQPIRLPEPGTLFAERAMRLRQLARGHAMGDYLGFMADVALAQSEAVQRLMQSDLPLPTPAKIAAARAVGLPPVPAVDWPRDPAWHAALTDILDRVQPPAQARPVVEQLRALDADSLERQADALLTGVMQGLDLAAAPLLAAALQAYFSVLVARTGAQHADAQTPVFTPSVDPSFCPCCGNRPVASVTRQVGDVAGQRYLHCSLCAAEWHLVRIQCSHCGSNAKLAYEQLEALDGGETRGVAATQAETCGDCGHYLKIVHTERDPFVEPGADDLATVTLDLLVAETGMAKHGVNLMLLFGEAEAGPDPDPGPP